MTLWQLIEERAAKSPRAMFAVDERERSLTFEEYRDAALIAAAAFLQLGVEPGDAVSWTLPTRLEALVLAAALSRLDVVQNPLLPVYRQREVSFAVRQTRARWLLAPSVWRKFDFAAMARSVAQESPGLRLIAGDPLPEGDPSTLPPHAGDARAKRWVFYTSGTTADPKGVKHSDESLRAAGVGLAERLELTPEDRFALVFPFTHVGGPVWLMAGLHAGSAHVLAEQFDARVTPEVLARHGVTLPGAGTVFHQAYLEAQRAHPNERLFPRARAFPGGGAPKPPQLHHDIRREMGGAGIVSGYGLTECPVLTMGSPHDPTELLAQTEGRVSTASSAIRVVKPDGSLAEAGAEGEIRVRAPQLFQGYVDPTLDAAAFDEQRFFRTGDLGKLDRDGFLTITGRLKDVIIRKGENISAREVEDLLHAHAKVKEVAVIGLADPKLGERCCAVIAPRNPEEPLRLAEMAEYLRSQGLMVQKIPEQLETVSELPRNANGKVLKDVLKERFSR